MWTHEESTESKAGTARIWQLFADVVGWKRWNAGIEHIEINGPFAEGTTFTMQPPGEAGILSKLITVVEGQSFTDETLVGETRVLVHHRIVALPSGKTKITFSTEISGPDAVQVGAMVTGDFPQVLASLKVLAEQPV